MGRKTPMLPLEVEQHSSGLMSIIWIIAGGAALFVALLVLMPARPMINPLETDSAAEPTTAPAIRAQPTPALPPQSVRQPIAAPVVVPQSSLPSCSTVRDTTTLCEPDSPPPAPAVVVEEQPTAAPVQFAPAAVECWQGSFYTCEELAEMGDERAVGAVEAADTFVDVSTLPTPPPAFVQYAQDACAAATVKSPLCP